MTEDEAYQLLAEHRILEDKEIPGDWSCGAIKCPHQYVAPTSRSWQAHRRHWALLIAEATADSSRAVRLLHQRSRAIPLTCTEDGKPWPCPTVEVLRQARGI